jgi:hypothetical protein
LAFDAPAFDSAFSGTIPTGSAGAEKTSNLLGFVRL